MSIGVFACSSHARKSVCESCADREFFAAASLGRRKRCSPQQTKHERERAEDAEGDAIAAKGVELRGDEVELPWKILEYELEHDHAIAFVRRDTAEHDQSEHGEREQGQQRVIGDRRRVREAVALEKAQERAVGGESCQPGRLTHKATHGQPTHASIMPAYPGLAEGGVAAPIDRPGSGDPVDRRSERADRSQASRSSIPR